MSEHTDDAPHIRRVVLPSGKTIEVVYFEEHPALAGRDPETIERRRTDDALHICGNCNGELVYPLDWEEASATHWEVTLRCPDCEWIATGTFAQDIVERFDEELDRGTAALIEDLARLASANMEEEIDRFVSALDADALLPEDFGRPATT
jgi:hypothetical protein